jgi:predicted O-methyltransferase YrrM
MKRFGSDGILNPLQARYLARIEPARDSALAAIEERARERGLPISDPEVCALLFATLRASRGRDVLELGTSVGYSAVVLARAGGVDARVVTVERDAALAEEARHNLATLGVADRVEVVESDALAYVQARREPVDFVYLDCVKEDYPAYLHHVTPLLRSGGVLVADNVLWGGLVARFDAGEAVDERELPVVRALHAFNEALLQHPKYRACILPLSDGVAVATKLGSAISMMPPPL